MRCASALDCLRQLSYTAWDSHVSLNDPAEHQEAAATIGRAIDAACDHEHVEQLVADYFEPNSRYAGLTFGSLEPNPPEDIVSADLLALNTLDVPVEAKAIRQLLGADEKRARALAHLAAIPAQTPLWEADDPIVASTREAWLTFKNVAGFGWVRVNKLLARKRPNLVPVYDTVVRSWLGAPSPLWEPLALALQDRTRRTRIERLRSDNASQASLLRILDVAIWMLHGKSAARSRESAGLSRTRVPAPMRAP